MQVSIVHKIRAQTKSYTTAQILASLNIIQFLKELCQFSCNIVKVRLFEQKKELL